MDSIDPLTWGASGGMAVFIIALKEVIVAYFQKRKNKDNDKYITPSQFWKEINQIKQDFIELKTKINTILQISGIEGFRSAKGSNMIQTNSPQTVTEEFKKLISQDTWNKMIIYVQDSNKDIEVFDVACHIWGNFINDFSNIIHQQSIEPKAFLYSLGAFVNQVREGRLV